MSTDDSVAGLRDVANQAIEKMAEAQAALSAAIEKLQEARAVMQQGLRGADSDTASSAMAAMVATDAEIGSAIQSSAVAVEQIVAWTATL